MRRQPAITSSGKWFHWINPVLGRATVMWRVSRAQLLRSLLRSPAPVCAVSFNEELGPVWWIEDVIQQVCPGGCAPSNIYHVGAVDLCESVSRSATFRIYWFNRVDAGLRNPPICLVDGEILQKSGCSSSVIYIWLQLQLQLGVALPNACSCNAERCVANLAFAWKSDFWKSDKRKGKGFTGNLQIPPLASSVA